MKNTIVSILCIGHSGSHYLSLLLGSHSKTMHLGEVHYLGKSDPGKRKKICSLCKDNHRCPIFGHVGPHNIGDVYNVILSHVAPGTTTLIDASKSIRWIKRFLGRTEFNMKYIHLLTDPRSLIRLWSLTYTTRLRQLRTRLRVIRTLPRMTAPAVFGTLHDVYMYDWLSRNQAITRFIQRHNLDASIVTYRDIATDPQGELKRLMDWIGLAYEPAQLAYWNVEHHGTQKQDYEWVKREKVRHIDLRWQNDLPQETIDRVAKNPAITAYLNQMGLALTDTGPTRVR